MKTISLFVLVIFGSSPVFAEKQRTLTYEELFSCLKKVDGLNGKPTRLLTKKSENEYFMYVKAHDTENRGFYRFTPGGVEHCDVNWPNKVYFKFNYNGESVTYETSDGTGADGNPGSPKGSKLNPQNAGDAMNCRKENEAGIFNLRKQIAALAGHMAESGKYGDEEEVYKEMGPVCKNVDYVGNAVEGVFAEHPGLRKAKPAAGKGDRENATENAEGQGD